MRLRTGWAASVVAAAAGAALFSAAGFAADDKAAPNPQAIEFFEAKVRPILFKNCFSCHGESQQMGGLRLDSAAALAKGGASGAEIVPGEPDKSRLIQAVHYDGKLKMPPAGKLSTDDIAALTAWVKMGAPWPSKIDSQESKIENSLWSLKPVKKPAPPAVKNHAWAISPVDAFVLAKLERKGLTPAPRADRRTLIRRATYDLTGLPPTPDEVDAFVNDKEQGAFARVVDRLLASPRYGERWGRYWLDVARYADTKGYVFVEDRMYHSGYTYRDYVIRSFNEDKPYDRFITEQLAADKLNLGDDQRPLAALGFLTLGRRFLNNVPDIIDDRIDVTTRGLMALTVNCARCHDHKFDPIPTKDYYSLYGVFASSVEPEPEPIISPKEVAQPYQEWQAKVLAAEKESKQLVLNQVAALRAKADKLPAPVMQTLQAIRLGASPSEGEITRLLPQFDSDAQKRLETLKITIDTLKRSEPQKPEFAMALQDAPAPVDQHVFIRGNPGNQGPEAPRQFLACVAGETRKPYTQGSGRLELAQAIASKDNPLTARVMVNRIWLHHFGYGLVRTPSDFGTRGEPPTHPELLDYLASRFVQSGWSIKKMHRLIMLSNTYMQSSDANARAATADAENRLLSHQNRRRLDFEATRDSLLAAAGHLDTTMGGPSVDILAAPFSTRRTVYGFIDRQNLPGLFRAFDFASPDTTSAQRYDTTVPQQALFLMNSPFANEQARFLAQRPDVRAKTDPARRILYLYRLLFARAPAQDELAWGLRFVERGEPNLTAQLASLQTDARSASSMSIWDRYVHVLMMSDEFHFVD